MKIIVLGTRGFPEVQGGVEKHCEELYPRLVDLGCEVTVVSRAPYTGKVEYWYQGVNILPIACPKHKFLEAFLHTFLGIFKAKELQCDILHVHAIGPSLFVPLARWLGLTVVMTHHGRDYERQKWNSFARFVLKLGERWGVTFANEVIAISSRIGQTLYERFGKKSTIIPNGVIVRERVFKDGMLKHFGLERGKYILAVGRFVPEKGFKELAESFYQFSLMELNPRERWKLVIVGDSDHENGFSQELKKRCGNIPDIVLTGFQTGRSLRQFYSHTGLFILPSFHEGLPIVLLEALSYGCSCVVSDIPANREIGLEEDRYFAPGNINLMTAKLREFFNRSPREEERRKRVQEVADKYDWEKIAQKTLQVYGNALSRPTHVDT